MNIDIEKIQKQFNEVLSYSQNEECPDTDKLFQDWATNKKRFIDVLGPDCRIETEDIVTFEMSDEIKKERIKSFLELIQSNYDPVVGHFFNAELDGIFLNKVVNPFDAGDIHVPVGMKIGRALNKYFYGYLTSSEIDTIQTTLSCLIQENKVCGKLCISVHPLDFLSVSENNYNWRSCHALDGEYRVGNLNYMADPCTVVVYLKGNEDTVLPRFPETVPWNDKKWRCLMFFDFERQIVWAGRQYPFFSSTALATVKNTLFKQVNCFDARRFDPWSVSVNEWVLRAHKTFTTIDGSEITTEIPYLYDKKHLVPLSDFVQDAPETFHYNDLLNSHYYEPWYYRYGRCCSPFSESSVHLPLQIGRKCNCIHCGTQPIEFSEAMYCKECILDSTSDSDELTHCTCCGTRILRDDDYCYDGEYYCEACYNNLELTICDACDEFYPYEEMYTDEHTGNVYCPSCWEYRHNFRR